MLLSPQLRHAQKGRTADFLGCCAWPGVTIVQPSGPSASEPAAPKVSNGCGQPFLGTAPRMLPVLPKSPRGHSLTKRGTSSRHAMSQKTTVHHLEVKALSLNGGPLVLGIQVSHLSRFKHPPNFRREVYLEPLCSGKLVHSLHHPGPNQSVILGLAAEMCNPQACCRPTWVCLSLSPASCLCICPLTLLLTTTCQVYMRFECNEW